MRRRRKVDNSRYPWLLHVVSERDHGKCQLAALLDHRCACNGPMDAAHLIRKNRIRNRYDGPADVEDVVWNPDLSLLACRRHHSMLDDRMSRLSRDKVPERAERAAAVYGLTWSLDRDYGLPVQTEAED